MTGTISPFTTHLISTLIVTASKEEKMEAEYLLVVILALLMVCAAMLTITTWNNVPELRITVIKNVFQYLLGLVSNVGIALFYWNDGIDYAAWMGPISLQAILFFFALALSVMFINGMQDLEEQAVAAT